MSLLSPLGNELRQDLNFPNCKIDNIKSYLRVIRVCGNNIKKEF